MPDLSGQRMFSSINRATTLTHYTLVPICVKNERSELIRAMNNSAMIEIAGVGPILFKKSNRARYVNIAIRLLKPVRVAVPSRISFENAERIVLSKVNWIRKHLNKLKSLEENHASRLVDISDMSAAQKKQKLISRISELAAQYKFSYNKVCIRSQRTRWGSCSARNDISLNIKLTQLPDRLIDYILLHELLHTRIKNHGRNFKKELNNLVGDNKALKAEFKLYHLDLIA